MKEAKLIGSLFPTSTDFKPIIDEIRKKYKLPEPRPEDEPITEIYLDDEIIPLEDFLEEIKTMVENSDTHLPPNLASLYQRSKKLLGRPLKMQGLEKVLPDDLKTSLYDLYKVTQDMMEFFVKLLDGHFQSIANMLYAYILTGETEEVPTDWISRVDTVTLNVGEEKEKIVVAFASQIADPDVVVQKFREQYKKTFGIYRPKVTKLAVSTAYYIRLKWLGKDWDYIVAEFIRLNNLKLPRDTSSERFVKAYQTYESRLRKRMQRYEKVYDVLLRDKN